MNPAPPLAPIEFVLIEFAPSELAPIGLVPMERRPISYSPPATPALAATGFIPVERRLHRYLVRQQKRPALHRDEPDGGGASGSSSLLADKPALHRGKPGGGGACGYWPLLADRPALHRGEPDGGVLRGGQRFELHRSLYRELRGGRAGASWGLLPIRARSEPQCLTRHVFQHEWRRVSFV